MDLCHKHYFAAHTKILRLAFKASLLVLLVLASRQGAGGTSLKILKPLAGIDRVTLSITIGGPLSLNGGTQLGLFRGDTQRASNFETTLKKDIQLLLANYGVSLNTSAQAEILVSIYGRPVTKPDLDHGYMFLLVVSLPTRLEGGTEPEEDLIPVTVIDVTTEQELEATLTMSILSLLRSSLEDAGKAHRGLPTAKSTRRKSQ